MDIHQQFNPETLTSQMRWMLGILDTPNICLYFKDLNGVYRDVNRVYCEVMGKTREEVLGALDEDLYSPEEAMVYRSGDLTVMQTGAPECRDWPMVVNGETRWFYSVKNAVPDGNGGCAGVFGWAIEITERKRAEIALRESEARARNSEARLKKAQRVARVGDWVWDVVPGKVELSDEMYPIFGLDPQTPPAQLYQAVKRTIHPEDLPKLSLSNLKNYQMHNPVEFRVLLPDGSVRHILAETGEVIVDCDGTPVYLSGTCSDITRRKTAELARDQQLRVVQSILDTTPDFLILKDRDLVYREVNQAFCNFIGKTREEILGKTDFELFAENDARVHQATDRAALASGCIQIGDEEVTRDGSPRWIHLIKSAVTGPEQQVEGVLCSVQDITERRQLEEALIESSERYRASFEDSQAVKLILDPAHGTILEANPAASRFYGYTLDELRGMQISSIHVAMPEEVTRPMKQARDRVETFSTFTHRLASGELRDVEVFSSPVKAGGKVLLHSIVHDVTQRKLADDVHQASLRLHEVPTDTGLEGLLQASLDIAEEMTGSQVGFFHFVEPDQLSLTLQVWSTRTLKEFCTADGKGLHYGLDQAGVWADCVRLRRAAVHNDYASLPNRKTLPDGHTTLVRELAAPIFDGDKIVAIVGLGNKPDDYRDRDVAFLQQFAMVSWDLAMIRRKDVEIKHSEAQLRTVLNATPDLVYSINRQLELEFINKPPVGINPRDLTRLNILEFIAPEFHSLAREKAERVFASGEPDTCTLIAMNMQGEMRWFENHLAPIFEGKRVKSVLGTSLDIHERILIEEKLRSTSAEISLAYDATLQGWSNALELRERETAGHSKRVVGLTLELARLMDIDYEEIIHIRRGALLHDVGKLGIPDSILLKPGPLSADEWVIMRQHPTYAYRLLSPIAYLKPALDIPYCHHERWDGSGYPRGLKGEAIPIAARIFAVVDVWDALLSDRPYRPAWAEKSVLEYLHQQSGRQFDPMVVNAFMSMVYEGRIEANS